MDQRGSGDSASYLVNWRGYPKDRATWEPVSHLANCRPLFVPGNAFAANSSVLSRASRHPLIRPSQKILHSRKPAPTIHSPRTLPLPLTTLPFVKFRSIQFILAFLIHLLIPFIL